MREEGLIYPREIILEVTNRCNLACRFCHFHGEEAVRRRPLGFMDKKIWIRVLDELSRWQRPCSLLTHGAGEPLLYPELEELLTRAAAIPHLRTGFMTNGMLLNREMAEKLVALQVDSIAFSIDGVAPETHDYFRRNADLRLIEENVKTLIREKEKAGSVLPVLCFNMVGYPEILDQADDYVARWLPHADHVMVSTFRPVGSRKLWPLPDAPSFIPCPLLYSQMVISVTGEVGLCCEDINLDVPLGSVMDTDLLSLFNESETLIHYRKAHEIGEIGSLNLCADCHVWGSAVALKERKLNMGGLQVHETVSPAGKLYRMS